MRKFFFVFLFIFVAYLTLPVFSQNPNPTATPDIKGDSDTINISTDLIRVDFIVTDKRDRIVKNLKADDFELFENDKKLEISNFSYISSKLRNTANNSTGDSLGLEDNSDGLSLKEKISIPTKADRVDPNKIRRTMVLVIDDIGLSFRSVGLLKKTLNKFIKEQVRSGDLVTVVTIAGASAIPAFTSDKKQLLAIVKKIKWNPRSRGGVDYYQPERMTLLEELSEARGG